MSSGSSSHSYSLPYFFLSGGIAFLSCLQILCQLFISSSLHSPLYTCSGMLCSLFPEIFSYPLESSLSLALASITLVQGQHSSRALYRSLLFWDPFGFLCSFYLHHHYNIRPQTLYFLLFRDHLLISSASYSLSSVVIISPLPSPILIYAHLCRFGSRDSKCSSVPGPP